MQESDSSETEAERLRSRSIFIYLDSLSALVGAPLAVPEAVIRLLAIAALAAGIGAPLWAIAAPGAASGQDHTALTHSRSLPSRGLGGGDPAVSGQGSQSPAPTGASSPEVAWEGLPPPYWSGPRPLNRKVTRARRAKMGQPTTATVDGPAPRVAANPDPQPRFARAARHDGPPHTRQRNLLKALGSLVAWPEKSFSDTARLLQRRPLLRKLAGALPDLVLDPSGIKLHAAKDSQLLTMAPGAMQRFERRIDVLHMMGLRHNDIRLENIVIDRYGELHLVHWNRAAPGGSAENDLVGLEAVRRFLRQRIGS